jgi:hypothetical protein
MTNKELTKKLMENHSACPYCSSENIDAGDYDGGHVLSLTVTCGDCGKEWGEEYRFSGAFNVGNDEDE